ncbi:uncharacterized protein LOC142986314 [Anticarsia gemmatalis]|uniref:uncharacterized protein LOC142986314 n=1 Tax=Anticarsia gemmatalis TaxID=129554 RepID=UPI003F75EB53
MANHKVTEQKPENTDNFNKTNSVSNEGNQTKAATNKLDYYINFLGVTLTDTCPTKIANKSIKDSNSKSENYGSTLPDYKVKVLEKENCMLKAQPPDSVCASKQLEENEPHKGKKCECTEKLDEFKSYMISVFNDQSKSRQINKKDIALDSQSLKFKDNNYEECVCCNNFEKSSSKELEVNTFNLLEDHLKEKLKQFKCSCKSECILPEQEEKIYSTIIKRVKQVISNCANEIQSSTRGGSQTEGSWKRAYGLLQEYLKIKIQRVHCLPFLNENKELVLPDILEKVCNLIENDFQRLKDICSCKKNEALKKKSLMEYLLQPNEELPERDTNTLAKKYDAQVECDSTKLLSKQNSVIHIALTENISSQVPPDLGMDTKSCDIMEIINNDQTTETNPFILNEKSQGVIYNRCDCYQNPERSKREILKLFGNKEVLVNLYADVLINSNDVGLSKSFNQQQSLIRQSEDETKNSKSLPDFKSTGNDVRKTTLKQINKQETDSHKSCLNLPYIGCTIDCVCDSRLKTCVCTKSAVKSKNDEINNIWNQLINSKKYCNQDLSYIMNGSRNKHNKEGISTIDKDSSSLSKSESTKLKKISVCEAETDVKGGEEIVLLSSKHKLDTIHQTTNTFEENASLITDAESDNTLDWYECPQTVKSEIISDMVTSADSPYFYESIDDAKSLKSDSTSDTESTKSSQKCNCDRVPICHVKMLVDSIEKSLFESKCTCESISKVCPVNL